MCKASLAQLSLAPTATATSVSTGLFLCMTAGVFGTPFPAVCPFPFAPLYIEGGGNVVTFRNWLEPDSMLSDGHSVLL